MNFNVQEATLILERTPKALEALLSGLSDGWLECREGAGTWSPLEVVGHLIEGEKHDWIPRLDIILQEGESRPFPPFDREAHLRESAGKPIDELLREFAALREHSLAKLRATFDPALHAELTGTHPAFGAVKARELLATWVAHDFTHLAQIARVMAERYREDVGPWVAYLGVLNQKRG